MSSGPELTATARSAMPFAATLGLELLSATAEEVRARIAFEERLCTAGRILHGGALMSLADAAGAYCAFLNLPEGSTGTATIESKTNSSARCAKGTSSPRLDRYTVGERRSWSRPTARRRREARRA